MIKRLAGILRKSEPPPPAGKAGGHGDHWGCLFREPERDRVLDAMRSAVEGGAPPEIVASEVAAYRSPGQAVCVCVIVRGERVVSAYPEILTGSAWPVTVTDVVPWASGLEGQVTGTCEDALVSFFDTRFYVNSARYTVGETYSFSMGAFAYRLGLADDIEAENEQGVKVSFKGARAYMAAPRGEGADIDDYWFHSPLEEAPKPVEMLGRRLTRYPIGLAIPVEFDMRLDLLAAEHVLQPGVAEAKVEDDLQGFLWLQGHLVEG